VAAFRGGTLVADESENFGALMQRLKEGSEDAARQIFERYGRHIHRIISRRLDRHVRPSFDSEDFTQAVWASFFAAPVRRRVFTGPDDLIAFLAKMAQNKVIEAYRQRVKTKKRDARKERPLPDSACGDGNAAIARQPTPSQVVSAQEQFDRLMERVPPEYQRILAMLKLGFTHREIANELKLNEKTVRRVLQRLRLGRAS
jgi:RNA polymerase sigma factor (sigma-70 family)